MHGISLLNAVLILWMAVTAILAGVLIYRALISMKEDDQLFLGAGETNLEREQQVIQSRLQHLAPYTKALSVTSGLLLMVGAGLWVYEQFTKPMFTQ